jgi:tRNA pseudouridine55 synthase
MPRTIATLDGVLLVDKPAGLTSHDVVALARRSLGVRRVGHTGTLDPFATGLLVLLVGQATRLARFVEDEPKVYEATIAFGRETDTDDVTGRVSREAELPVQRAIDAGIRALTGPIEQLPPAFSAKKIAGRRAYDAARAGTPLTLAPVSVTVFEWRIRHRAAATLDVTITCSGGTYIRALARDLGRAASSAAHLTALRRLRTGVLDIRNARTIDELRRTAPTLEDMRAAIPKLPSQTLDQDAAGRVRQGQSVAAHSDAPVIALIDAAGGLVAIAIRDGDQARPSVVMQHDF